MRTILRTKIRQVHEPTTHWMISGRGFRALEPEAPGDQVNAPETNAEPEIPTTEVVAAGPVSPAADDEAAERVSRYNFEELGRILTDRVATDGPERTQTAASECTKTSNRERDQSQRRDAGAQPAAAGHLGVPRPAGAVCQPGADRPARLRRRRGAARRRDCLDLSDRRRRQRRAGQPAGAPRRYFAAGHGAAAVGELAGPPGADAVGKSGGDRTAVTRVPFAPLPRSRRKHGTKVF